MLSFGVAQMSNKALPVFQVPHVTRTDYQLIDISEDGFVRSQILLLLLVEIKLLLTSEF